MEYQQLDTLIDHLSDVIDAHNDGATNWKAVWDDIRTISASFKTVRYPTREERQGAWDRKQSLIDQIRVLQDSEYARRRQFSATSEKHRSTIESLADAGKPDSGFGDIALAMATGGLSLIGKRIMDDIFGETDEIKEELDRRSLALNEAGWYLRDHKGEMKRADKDAAFQYIASIRESLNDDWSKWKQAKSAAHEERQRQWEYRQRERSDKRERWLNSQHDFIELLESKIERLEPILENKRNNLDKLHDMQSTARGDFSDTVDGWIDECQASISDLESKIDAAQEKIREVRAGLN